MAKQMQMDFHLVVLCVCWSTRWEWAYMCLCVSWTLFFWSFLHSVQWNAQFFRCECVLVCQSTPSEKIAHTNFSFVKNNFLSLVLLLLLLSCVCCFALFLPCCFVIIVSYLYFLSIDWKTKFAFLGILLPNLFILLIFFQTFFWFRMVFHAGQCSV